MELPQATVTRASRGATPRGLRGPRAEMNGGNSHQKGVVRRRRRTTRIMTQELRARLGGVPPGPAPAAASNEAGEAAYHE